MVAGRSGLDLVHLGGGLLRRRTPAVLPSSRGRGKRRPQPRDPRRSRSAWRCGSRQSAPLETASSRQISALPRPMVPSRSKPPRAPRWPALAPLLNAAAIPGRREFRATWAAARAREGEADPARPIESRREVVDIDVRSIRCVVKVCAALGGPFRRRRLPCRAAPGVRPEGVRAESGPTTRPNGFVLGVEKVAADSCATSSHSRQPLLRSTRKPDG